MALCAPDRLDRSRPHRLTRKCHSTALECDARATASGVWCRTDTSSARVCRLEIGGIATEPVVIWLIFVLGVGLLCLLRPNAGRIFVGLFFWVMALGINAVLTVRNPQGYVDFVNGAYLALYRDWFSPLVEFSPRLIGLLAALFEIGVGSLLLAKGRAVKLGLIGAIVFLLGITPLGKEELPNPVLALALVYLLTKDFKRSLPDIVRSRLQTRGIRGKARA